MRQFRHKRLNITAKKVSEESYIMKSPMFPEKTIPKQLIEHSPEWEEILETCDRCGNDTELEKRNIGYTGTNGEIRLEAAAQAFGYLQGAKYIASKKHFENWNVQNSNSPITKNRAQEVEFKWGTNNKDYNLCWQCQKELLRVIGAFFGYGNQNPKNLYSDNYETK